LFPVRGSGLSALYDLLDQVLGEFSLLLRAEDVDIVLVVIRLVVDLYPGPRLVLEVLNS